MSKQREWQKRQQAAGKCVICGNERDCDSGLYCQQHRADRNRRLRERRRKKAEDVLGEGK